MTTVAELGSVTETCPEHILVEIFSCLADRDCPRYTANAMAKLGLVCKRWRNALLSAHADMAIWCNIDPIAYFVSSLRMLQLGYISAELTPPIPPQIIDANYSPEKLRKIDSFYNRVCHSTTRVTSTCSLATTMEAIRPNPSNIRELSIVISLIKSETDDLYAYDVETGSVEGVFGVLKPLRNLESLRIDFAAEQRNVSGSTWFDKHIVVPRPDFSLPKTREIKISGSPNVGEFLQAFPALEKLAIQGFTGEKIETYKNIPNLKKLALKGNMADGVLTAALRTMTAGASLRSLTVEAENFACLHEFCSSPAAASLRKLKISAMRSSSSKELLSALTKASRSLEKLTLRYVYEDVPSAKTEEIEFIEKTFLRIKHLRVCTDGEGCRAAMKYIASGAIEHAHFCIHGEHRVSLDVIFKEFQPKKENFTFYMAEPELEPRVHLIYDRCQHKVIEAKWKTIESIRWDTKPPLRIAHVRYVNGTDLRNQIALGVVPVQPQLEVLHIESINTSMWLPRINRHILKDRISFNKLDVVITVQV